MKKFLVVLVTLLVFAGCAPLQNYNNLSSRDKAFYNLLWIENQNPDNFSALITQHEKDQYLNKLGFLQNYQALPKHVQSAIVEHEIVLGAPEFAIYMAAGKPIKQRRQVTMENGDIKDLFYLRCSYDAGANAGVFVNNASTCPAKVSSVLLSSISPLPHPRDPLLAEAIPYVVRVVAGKVDSIKRIDELPQ